MIRKTACNFFSKKGFTLIELVVSFSIMAVLSTIGVAAFVSYSHQQALQQATNDLANTLKTTRANAASQLKPNDCLAPTNKTLDSYQIVLIKGSNSYQVQVICDGDYLNPHTVGGVVKLSSSNKIIFDPITFQPSATTGIIQFNVLTGGVILKGLASDTITLDGYNSSTKTITVDSVGNVTQ